jgi:hypothetical protein
MGKKVNVQKGKQGFQKTTPKAVNPAQPLVSSKRNSTPVGTQSVSFESDPHDKYQHIKKTFDILKPKTAQQSSASPPPNSPPNNDDNNDNSKNLKHETDMNAYLEEAKKTKTELNNAQAVIDYPTKNKRKIFYQYNSEVKDQP